MRVSGRLSATIMVLEDFEARRVPLKAAIADWARSARYAGSKDRAWVSGLALDVLRRRRSLASAMEDNAPRAAVFAALKGLWGITDSELAELAAEAPHGPGALSIAEVGMLSRVSSEALTASSGSSVAELSDIPDWLAPHVARTFGGAANSEMSALASRADVDLRINTLKVRPENAISALRLVGATEHPLLTTAARIAAPPPSEKTPDVTVIPAFNKGWVEVQDAGSQIATLAAGEIKGAQVLDFCAGGGGKTLALAAMMENTGQIYAYDADAARLRPIYERARRAGVRNLQIINPLSDEARLGLLEEKMDVVFLDAPCSGSGVWRRHPDSKWRLTPDQLARRIAEQDKVVAAAAKYVKPGGRLVYVTCSIFMEENEDRLERFAAANPAFSPTPALRHIEASNLASAQGLLRLASCQTAQGALRLTPLATHTDGFFIAVLVNAAS